MEKFKETKIGDIVFVCEKVQYQIGGCKEFYLPKKVTRTTKTQITLENGEKYNKKGTKIGGKYGERIYFFGEKFFLGDTVCDQTQERDSFVAKLKIEREIKAFINSLQFEFNPELSIDRLLGIKKQLLEIKNMLK